MNTAAKRASALGVALVFTVLSVPSGAVDRQTSAHTYTGIAASVPVVITDDCYTGVSSPINAYGAGVLSAVVDTHGIVSHSVATTGLSSGMDDSDTGVSSPITDTFSISNSVC